MPSATNPPATIRTVLVGSSLHEASDAVVRNGLRVARACGARIHIAHAFQATLAYSTGAPYAFSPVITEWIETARDAARGHLDAQVERLGIRPAELAGITVREGAPHVVLAETAAEIDADLLVVADAEIWARVAKLLGSTADRVVRVAPCPVLVVRGELMLPPRRVLAAVDLSPLSATALERGLHVVAALGAAAGSGAIPVDVLFVDERRPTFYPGAPELAMGETGFPAAREALDDLIAGIPRDRRWQITPRVRTASSAAAEIVAMTDELEVDLVVVGTHGRRAFQRALIGSVAERVLRNCSRSVLVVPRQAWHEPIAASSQIAAANSLGG